MKRYCLITIVFMLLIGCGAKVEEENNAQQHQEDVIERSLEDEQSLNESELEEKKVNSLELKVKTVNGVEVFLVDEFVSQIDGSFQYNDMHRLLTMEIEDHIYKIVYGIPVLEHNGLYLPTDQISLIIDEDKPYLPLSFLQIALELDVTMENQVASFTLTDRVVPATAIVNEQFLDQEWTGDQMIDYLSFLEKPIKDAEVSTIPNHLPGAKRAYRNGYHEGIDWYGYATGQNITTDTPIYAMAEGVVVRADHDFEEYPSPLIRNKDLTLTSQLGETPEYIFDRLRGKQVWVQYENGVMNRFAHLDSIPETITVGDKVTSETIIGFVGNSGTSGAVNQDGTQLHLHQDLLIYGELFWKPFTLDETKEILVAIFGN